MRVRSGRGQGNTPRPGAPAASGAVGERRAGGRAGVAVADRGRGQRVDVLLAIDGRGRRRMEGTVAHGLSFHKRPEGSRLNIQPENSPNRTLLHYSII